MSIQPAFKVGDRLSRSESHQPVTPRHLPVQPISNRVPMQHVSPVVVTPRSSCRVCAFKDDDDDDDDFAERERGEGGGSLLLPPGTTKKRQSAKHKKTRPEGPDIFGAAAFQPLQPAMQSAVDHPLMMADGLSQRSPPCLRAAGPFCKKCLWRSPTPENHHVTHSPPPPKDCPCSMDPLSVISHTHTLHTTRC